jgi:hypothetical protein
MFVRYHLHVIPAQAWIQSSLDTEDMDTCLGADLRRHDGG